MSSATTAVVEADAVTVTVAETVEKPPRRFPPPCWTQEETLALIEGYRERWYALRRGYLRTADWDAVAAAVSSSCPGASPAKTSAQCRHKMEKLRQRYRAEKQRAISFPYPAGRYFSTWFFFENMEAMENGTTPPPSSAQKPENSGDGSRLKSYLDQNILKLKLRANNPDLDSDPGLGFDNSAVKAKRFNLGTKIPSEYSPYMDMQAVDNDDEEEDMPQVDPPNLQWRNGIRKLPSNKPKSKRAATMFDNANVGGGFHQQILPPGLRVKKLGKFDPNIDSGHNNEDFWVKSDIDNRAKYWSGINAGPDSREGPALKRGRNALEEIVGSIKLLGEGFVRMEKAKMEMAREMEAMRMEMEMKRNEMLLESQKQIVDAFLKGLFELKKSKKVKTAAADSAEHS